MALLKFDGFEGYSDPDDMMGSGSIISTFNRDVWSLETGRNGGKSLRYKANNVWDGYLTLNFPTIDEDYSAILGFALKWNHHVESMDGANSLLKFGYSTSYDVFRIQSHSNGDITFGVYADGNQWKSAETYHMNADEWYYIEIKFRVHGTLGVGQMRINEQSLYSWSGDSLTGTNVFPPYDIAFCQFGLPGDYQETQYSVELDDIYIADTSGSENNDFLGDIRIDAIHPSGAGNHTDFTPSTGSNYQCVDEVAIDESDYVSGATAGNKDSYAYDDVPTDLDDAGIIGLQIRNFGKRTATADNRKIDPFIRISTTDYSQVAQDLPDAFGEVRGDIVLDDPSDSNPWTQSKINACEFGMEVG